jgi:hypothetical protein
MQLRATNRRWVSDTTELVIHLSTESDQAKSE